MKGRGTSDYCDFCRGSCTHAERGHNSSLKKELRLYFQISKIFTGNTCNKCTCTVHSYVACNCALHVCTCVHVFLPRKTHTKLMYMYTFKHVHDLLCTIHYVYIVYLSYVIFYYYIQCRFQQNFLDQLESRIDFSNLQDSLIGEIFVIMVSGFTKFY